jgi:hypothetical protein
MLAWRAAWIASSALCTDLCARQLCGLPEGEDRWRVHRMICDTWACYSEDRNAAPLLELAHGASHARFGLSEMPAEVLPLLQAPAERLASVIHHLQDNHDEVARHSLLREARMCMITLFERMLNAAKMASQGEVATSLERPSAMRSKREMGGERRSENDPGRHGHRVSR